MSAASILAIAASIVAVIAFSIARRTARRLAMLEEMYWQLKFDHGELKAKVDPSTPKAPEPKQTFVPLLRQAPRATGSADER